MPLLEWHCLLEKIRLHRRAELQNSHENCADQMKVRGYWRLCALEHCSTTESARSTAFVRISTFLEDINNLVNIS